MRDAQSQHVLVVEPDTALRRVMALGLRRRGLNVIEARSLGDVWERLTTPPAALVLDVGPGAASEGTLLRTLGGHRALRHAPLLLLAWDCPAETAPTGGPHPASALDMAHAPARVCLSKPFDARAFYVAVEHLLAEPTSAPISDAVRAGAPATPTVTPERSSLAGASIWPLVAAGAATLAAAGLLIQPVFALVGVALLVAAVLWGCTASAEPMPV